MIFAFATLAFAVTAWLAIVVLAATFEDYGPKMRAALSGKPPASLPPVTIRLRPRYQLAPAVKVRARPALRAAA
jgi:hypothetical protein